MGVVLPAQAWRNQLPLDHPKRTGTFSAFHFIVRACALIQIKHRSRSRSATPTQPTTSPPSSVQVPRSPLRPDTCLARKARSAAPMTSRWPGWRPRSLSHAGRQRHRLDNRSQPSGRSTRRSCSRACTHGCRRSSTGCPRVRCPADVAGYRIIAANCNGSGIQVAGYARLSLRLQHETNRPAVVSCVGDSHLALLASGIAATCAGLHGMSFTYPPAALPVGEDAEDEGLGIFVYHRAVLGNVGKLGREGEPARRAVFRNVPCPCGHHGATSPPEGRQQIVAHSSWSVGVDAREFCTPATLVAEQQLARRASEAERQRAFLRLSRLKTGFAAVPRVAAEFRAGIPRDDAGEQR